MRAKWKQPESTERDSPCCLTGKPLRYSSSSISGTWISTECKLQQDVELAVGSVCVLPPVCFDSSESLGVKTLLIREQKHLGHEVRALQDFPPSQRHEPKHNRIYPPNNVPHTFSLCWSKPSLNADLSEELPVTWSTAHVGVKVAWCESGTVELKSLQVQRNADLVSRCSRWAGWLTDRCSKLMKRLADIKTDRQVGRD